MHLATSGLAVLVLAGAASAQVNGPISLTWSTIDCGGGTSSNGALVLSGTIGQHDAGAAAAGAITIASGFWPAASIACYADCDTSTGPGILDIFDFLCFQNRYVLFDPYACDCDTSTGSGTCDIFDFLCFQNAFAAGCP